MGRMSTERFEKFVSPEPNSGCWLWMGALHPKGYGLFSLKHTLIGAHRASFILYRGEIPESAHVCHRCDVRCCVNPDHLFLATNAENVADKVKKNRQAKGTGLPHAKLTPAQVISIRSTTGISQRALARQFGVTRNAIRNILCKKSWKSVK
jgi:DNA-binding XRE family transcriptional regulator